MLIFLILSYSACFGQRLEIDTIAREDAIESAKLQYEKTIAGNSQLFNGVRYVDVFMDKKQIGHPFYFNDDWEEGFVHYDGQLYEHVLLRYNIIDENILIDHVQSHATIKLNVEKIKYFGINNHTFVWLKSDPENTIQKGFYDLLYSNKSKIYAKRYKTTIDIAEEKVMEVKFVDKIKLFLVRDDKYYTITNKKSVLNAFGESKSVIKKFLSQEKINFQSDPEFALIALTTYYDELKK